MNVMLVSYALLGFPFIEMLRKYLAHFLNSHSFNWNFTVSLTFSIFRHGLKRSLLWKESFICLRKLPLMRLTIKAIDRFRDMI